MSQDIKPGLDGFGGASTLPAHNLKGRAVGAARWTGISAVATLALQFALFAVLGRLLGPQAFGLMAMVGIVVNLAQLFGQAGLSQALIHRKDPTREEFSSLYWLNVALGVGTFLVLLAATPLVSRGFGAPELNALLPVAALSFLVAPFGFQFRALAQKALRFRLLAAVDIATSALTLAVALPAAWFFDQGVWSLVWGYLAGAAVGAAILTVSGWRTTDRPLLRFRRADLTGYLSFGLYRTGALILNFFNTRVAQILVGALLGAQALGYFSVAATLVTRPLNGLTPILTQVAFPVFSAVQEDSARLRRGYLQTVHAMMFLASPVLIGAAAVAPTAVPLLLGEQWTEAVPLVQALAIYSLLRSPTIANGSLLLARGRADWGFYWNLAQFLLVPPMVYLGSLSGDALYVAVALVAIQLPLSFVNYRVFTAKLIGPCFGPYARAVWGPIALAGLMGLVVVSAKTWLGGLPSELALGLQVLVGAVSYPVFALLFQRGDTLVLLGLLGRRT